MHYYKNNLVVILSSNLPNHSEQCYKPKTHFFENLMYMVRIQFHPYQYVNTPEYFISEVSNNCNYV